MRTEKSAIPCVPARTLQGKSSQFDVLIRRSDASGNSAPRTLPMHEVEGRRQVGGLVRGKTEEDFQGMRGGSIRPMWGEVRRRWQREIRVAFSRATHIGSN